MGTVLDFMPEEQREEYSAMTGQLLFYVAREKRCWQSRKKQVRSARPMR
jgi:hypothetical protein